MSEESGQTHISGLREILGAGSEETVYAPREAAKRLKSKLLKRKIANLDLIEAALERMPPEDRLRVMALILDVSKRAERRASAAGAMRPNLGIKIDIRYPFAASSHEGPRLRKALGLSERGFRKLCRRANVRGTAKAGTPTVYSRTEVKTLIQRRGASMSHERQEELQRQLAAAGFVLPFN